ncbi:MAG TPA: thiamine pyrophosphate-dependent dehydrogenase E1 component subunit alpha [Chloroflexota bacterium]|nr:thiamine pyrophosphate-dependent dehydrogenase E1 component subunit alpha [Chloroflexota bacterium]
MTSTDMRQAPHLDAGLTPEDLRTMYYYMSLTRALEERVRSLYLQGKLVGGVYTSRGQEGTAVASAYAMQPQDVCAPLIRDLGATMTRGVPPRAVLAQWLGRVGGPTGGRDTNLHFGDMGRGILAPISMLGATIPLCAGVALAARQCGRDSVALAYVGDGGSNTGDFHEGMNFAAALRLPLVVIVENNGYAYSTPVSQHVAIESFADRAVAYGVPGWSMDGNDVIEVYRLTRDALERARRGDGPTLLEARTFRMRGHAEHDDASYVPKELVAAWAQRDPIHRLAHYLDEHGLWTPDDQRTMEDRIKRDIDESLEWAVASPMPDGVTQTADIYAE